MVWYGMVWYGMVWYGMVWYGMVWYGMVWHGIVRYGIDLIVRPLFHRRVRQQGLSKSVQELLHGIEAVLALTLIILKERILSQ